MGTARSGGPGDVTTCAICGKPAVRGAVVDARRGVDAFPFCSFRCQIIDLGKWLGEEYRIPDSPDQSGGGVDAPPAPGDERDD